jgi:hypothetical protein
MLEVREIRAHLEGSLICFRVRFRPSQSSFNPWDYVRDLFTIARVVAFIR